MNHLPRGGEGGSRQSIIAIVVTNWVNNGVTVAARMRKSKPVVSCPRTISELNAICNYIFALPLLSPSLSVSLLLFLTTSSTSSSSPLFPYCLRRSSISHEHTYARTLATFDPRVRPETSGCIKRGSEKKFHRDDTAVYSERVAFIKNVKATLAGCELSFFARDIARRLALTL